VAQSGSALVWGVRPDEVTFLHLAKTRITDVVVIKAPDLPKPERTLGTIACQEKSG